MPNVAGLPLPYQRSSATGRLALRTARLRGLPVGAVLGGFTTTPKLKNLLTSLLICGIQK
jgi:hypothetical protein